MAIRPPLRARKRRQGGSPLRRQPMGIRTASAYQPRPPSKGVVRPTAQPAPTYAPVGTPAPPAPTTPPRTAGSQGIRNQAEANLGIAKGQNRDAVYRAIMQLGDPSQFAKYGADPNFVGYQFAQDPNSIWAQLGRQETQGLQDIDTSSNVGNTFFSGFRLKDRQNLTDETGRQRLGASTSFADDLKNLAAALAGSESDYRAALSQADQADIDAALEAQRFARDTSPLAEAGPPVEVESGPQQTVKKKPKTKKTKKPKKPRKKGKK